MAALQPKKSNLKAEALRKLKEQKAENEKELKPQLSKRNPFLTEPEMQPMPPPYNPIYPPLPPPIQHQAPVTQQQQPPLVLQHQAQPSVPGDQPPPPPVSPQSTQVADSSHAAQRPTQLMDAAHTRPAFGEDRSDGDEEATSSGIPTAEDIEEVGKYLNQLKRMAATPSPAHTRTGTPYAPAQNQMPLRVQTEQIPAAGNQPAHTRRVITYVPFNTMELIS